MGFVAGKVNRGDYVSRPQFATGLGNSPPYLWGRGMGWAFARNSIAFHIRRFDQISAA